MIQLFCMDDQTNNQNQSTQKTFLDTISSVISNLFSQVQTYFTNQKINRLQKIQAETTKQQWGDEKVFKQGANSGATNIAPKKPETKKEPLLK